MLPPKKSPILACLSARPLGTSVLPARAASCDGTACQKRRATDKKRLTFWRFLLALVDPGGRPFLTGAFIVGEPCPAVPFLCDIRTTVGGVGGSRLTLRVIRCEGSARAPTHVESFLLAMHWATVALCALVAVVVGPELYFRFLRPTCSWDEYRGEWALVTGSSFGIGRAFALELAKRGLNVVLHARTRSKLEQVAAEVRAVAPGVQVRVIVQDAVNDPQWDSMAAQIAALGGPVTVLINNIGGANPAYDGTFAQVQGVVRQRGVESDTTVSFTRFPSSTTPKCSASTGTRRFAGRTCFWAACTRVAAAASSRARRSATCSAIRNPCTARPRARCTA